MYYNCLRRFQALKALWITLGFKLNIFLDGVDGTEQGREDPIVQSMVVRTAMRRLDRATQINGGRVAQARRDRSVQDVINLTLREGGIMRYHRWFERCRLGRPYPRAYIPGQ